MPLPPSRPAIDTLRRMLHTALNIFEFADFTKGEVLERYRKGHADLTRMANEWTSEETLKLLHLTHDDPLVLKLRKMAEAIEAFSLSEEEEERMQELGRFDPSKIKDPQDEGCTMRRHPEELQRSPKLAINITLLS